MAAAGGVALQEARMRTWMNLHACTQKTALLSYSVGSYTWYVSGLSPQLRKRARDDEHVRPSSTTARVMRSKQRVPVRGASGCMRTRKCS